MKFSIKIDKSPVLLIPNKEFGSYSDVIAWFRNNFTCDANLCIEEVLEKKYKVVYNEIKPNYMIISAKDEMEAINKVRASLENRGLVSYELVTTIEQK